MKNNTFSEYIKPTVVLTVICLVVALILAGTYTVTKPIIEEINKATADAARAEVLPAAGADGGGNAAPDADASNPDAAGPADAAGGGFTEVPQGSWTLTGVEEVYRAENGAGTVFTVADRGFGGKLTVMVGISEAGEITGVKVTKHSETPGLGTKAMTEDYLSQYLGAKAVSLSGGGEDVKIDTITGATISSSAVFRAVDLALEQYAAGVGDGSVGGTGTAAGAADGTGSDGAGEGQTGTAGEGEGEEANGETGGSTK